MTDIVCARFAYQPLIQRTILFLVPDDSASQKHLEQRVHKYKYCARRISALFINPELQTQDSEGPKLMFTITFQNTTNTVNRYLVKFGRFFIDYPTLSHVMSFI